MLTIGFIQVILLILVVIVISIILLLKYDLNTNELDINMVTHSNSSYLTPTHMFISRVIMFFIISWSCLYIYFDRKGLDISLFTRGKVHDITLKHEGRFTAFTVWCWTLQGVYFFFAIISSINHILVEYHQKPIFEMHNEILFITWVIFEISFSMSFLVTIVVTFVLIPSGIKKGISNDGMFKFFPLLFHNANVAFMVWEILTNKFKFSMNHFPFVLLYGCAYSIFSWYFFYCRKVFLYFFLDYDAPYAIPAYLGLLTAVSVFFILGYFISIMKENNNIYINILIVVFTISVMRFTKPNIKNLHNQ